MRRTTRRIGRPLPFFQVLENRMTTSDRTMLRAAVLIHEQLSQRHVQNFSRCLPEYSWAAAVRLRRQIVRAKDRGWHRAAGRLMGDLGGTLRRCQMELETVLHTIEPATSSLCIPSPSDIYQDIGALRTEFAEVEIDLQEHELCVTTDAIVLEGIDLGRFQIHLDWHRLGSPPAYRVMALDPNPAAANEEVTHPHVQGEILCEGDGRAAIRAVLAQGRIYDLFLLVSQLLHTYGRGSSYVELDDWDGITCDDCGRQIREADSYGCSRCGSTLCDECSHCCAACEESHCSGCLSTCPECEQDFCRSCLETCPRCRRRVCRQCMEDGLCVTCHEKQLQDEEQDDDDSEATNQNALAAAETERPVAPAEPHRLGEAVVSA